MFVIDLNLARYLGKTYGVQKCKIVDIKNFILVPKLQPIKWRRYIQSSLYYDAY